MSTFPEFAKKYGAGVPYATVSQDVLQLYQGLLPEPLLKEWAAVGWCSYEKGFLWLVNPTEFTDVLKDWFEPSDQALVFARTAFGDLFMWRNNEIQYLHTQYARTQSLSDDIEIFFDYFDFSICDHDYFDGALEQKLFPKALEKFGQLEPSECYGFEPVLALGGSGTLETNKKVALREYLSFLSQVATV
jgi:hypothetical protein